MSFALKIIGRSVFTLSESRPSSIDPELARVEASTVESKISFRVLSRKNLGGFEHAQRTDSGFRESSSVARFIDSIGESLLDLPIQLPLHQTKCPLKKLQESVLLFSHEDLSGHKLLQQLAVGLGNPENHLQNDVYQLLKAYERRKNEFHHKLKSCVTRPVMIRMSLCIRDFAERSQEDQNISSTHRPGISNLLEQSSTYLESLSTPKTEFAQKFSLRFSDILSNPTEYPARVLFNILLEYISTTENMNRMDPDAADRMDESISIFLDQPNTRDLLKPFQWELLDKLQKDRSK